MRAFAPNGREIVGTAESMPCMYEIADDSFAIVNGELTFEHTGEYKDYYDAVEQNHDAGGQPLYQDEDGIEWPQNKLVLETVAGDYCEWEPDRRRQTVIRHQVA